MYKCQRSVLVQKTSPDSGFEFFTGKSQEMSVGKEGFEEKSMAWQISSAVAAGDGAAELITASSSKNTRRSGHSAQTCIAMYMLQLPGHFHLQL